ncbi:MAG TPA: SUMF1/EgtB/PvdO family nonheme iron enzyme [Pyrinomonadaceae bacterium]|nr:SUMF1/EgtB/PvdO family nonheme iron enzyme [Pyrinomonadaceae bacterium]
MKECPACRRCFPDDIIHCPQDGDATTPSLVGEPILDARYQLERRLGQGGMGVVFQARHIFLKTSHAIKVILPDLVGNDPMLVTRFRQEALAAAAIRHQNIIAVTDFGVVRGTMPFLVMEFVKGRSLQDILADEKIMAPDRALEFICAIGSGVAAAHRQNIVHRDLKPLNIMAQTDIPIAEGLKILDFGLAKIKSGELLGSFVQAKTSGMMGSPFYMAPEQWSDDEPDARADIYSLGIIMFQMLAGDVPFKGSSIPSIMKKHLTLPVPSFKSFGVEISPRIEAVVQAALEKDVAARMESVDQLISELRDAVAASTSPSRSTGLLEVHETLLSPATVSKLSTGSAKADQTQVETRGESSMGSISSAALSPSEQKKLAISQADYDREQEHKDRFAREELAREAEARKLAAEEKERKQKAEQEKERHRQEELTRQQKEKEERERQQREQMERVERQARELEERLARLATSMPPSVGVVDVEATQVSQNIPATVPGNNSYPGVAPERMEISIPAKSRNNSLLMIGGGIVLVLLIAGAIIAFLLTRSSSTTVPPGPPAVVNQPPVGQESIKADLVEIPGGTFQMGRNTGPPQERPAHEVTVQKFFMDRTEVTNAEYADFVRDANYEVPSHWVRGQPLPGQEKWPVVNVSQKDAEAFASWRSKRDGVTYRLPTEEEWEFAARNGGEFLSYPWGNTWQERRAVVKEASPRPVGTYADGKNRWGVVDLIGNAWEWTSSKASVYTGAADIPDANKEWIVVRGGSYASDPADRQLPISATYRDWFEPTLRHPNFGFRLVRGQ